MLEKLTQDEQIKLRWNAVTQNIDFAEKDSDNLLKDFRLPLEDFPWQLYGWRHANKALQGIPKR